MRLAVFDIDGTLITGPSTEKRFFLHLLRAGRIGPRQVLAFLWFLCRWTPRYGRHVLKKNKAYLAWLPVADVQALASEWAVQCLEAAGFAPCLERLRRHQDSGDVVVLLSGTPDFIATAIAAALGVERAIGTRCAVREGRFRASPPLSHPFTARKAEIVAELAHTASVALSDTVAYGDSIYELPVFEAVGTVVAVRPDEELAIVAERLGWEIIGPVRQGWLWRVLPALAARSGPRDSPAA